jgi:small subunit ribosomal protein S10
MPKARISLASIEVDKINQICNSIVEIAKKTKTKMSGPIALPTKRMKITTRKTPCGDGKASFDRFEMRVHKRMIDLGIDERALRLVMRVPIPEGVSIEIEMLEN